MMFGRRRHSPPLSAKLRHPAATFDMKTAKGRWAYQNHRARLDPHCLCGAPATWEQRIPASDGYSLTLTCDAHLYVNDWTQVGDGPWVPGPPRPISYWAAAHACFVPFEGATQ